MGMEVVVEQFSQPQATVDTFLPRHYDVELLAFKYWQDRGEPFGTPEVDWFRAEEELKRSAHNTDSALKTVAREIGSALGSVAALAANVLGNAAENANDA
jgi:hypothetical protein